MFNPYQSAPDSAPMRPLSAAFVAFIAAATRLDLTASTPAGVEALLGATQFDDASLAPYLNFVPGRYTRNAIYRDTSFELLVLCWSPGSRSLIHDHGGSRCFVSVQRGSLTVENYTLLENGRAPGHARLSRTDTQTMSWGTVDVRTADRDVHRVGARGGPAVSLHLYAKPLDTCLLFDVTQQTCRIAVNRYDVPPANNERVRSMAVVASSSSASTIAGRAFASVSAPSSLRPPPVICKTTTSS
jgi:cysteine dioxygenase